MRRDKDVHEVRKILLTRTTVIYNRVAVICNRVAVIYNRVAVIYNRVAEAGESYSRRPRSLLLCLCDVFFEH